jgi:hypothetical protein
MFFNIYKINIKKSQKNYIYKSIFKIQFFLLINNMDPIQNWINDIAMQLGLTPDYTFIPDQINVNVDYNASYGLPLRVPHVGNVPIPYVGYLFFQILFSYGTFTYVFYCN